MTRKSFIEGLLASAGCAGCQTGGWLGAHANLQFGVISDLHITTPESTKDFRRALRYFRSRGADAVLIAGDLSDWGLRSGYRYVKQAWDDEMSGSGIVPLMVSGNHDYEGFGYGDMTLDMHIQGYSENDALVRYGMKTSWEEAFKEKFEDIRLREVNGYKFVSVEWIGNDKKEIEERTAKWLSEHRNELKGDKPCFFFRHEPIPGTVSSSPKDKGDLVRKELEAIGNCVALTGHTHWTYNDERSIWQGAFTALSIPSMSYTSIPRQYDNGYDIRKPDSKVGMQCLNARPAEREATGYFVRVTDESMIIERHDFEIGEDTAAPWVVPLNSTLKPFVPEVHAKATAVPSFKSGESVSTRMVNSVTRNNRWTIFVGLTFGSAHACGGRVYDYESRVVGEDGKQLGVKRYLSPAFYLPEAEEPERQDFLFDGFDLPERGKFRFEVVARNCYGAASKPIYSKWYSPFPGKNTIKYKSWKSVVAAALVALGGEGFGADSIWDVPVEQKCGKILSTGVVCKEPGRYLAWPTICRRRNGELLVVFSGDRDEHICPWGKVQLVRSSDEGKTWSEPVTIRNSIADDRDAGIIELADGTLLVNWFTSRAWQSLPAVVHTTYDPAGRRTVDQFMRHLDKIPTEYMRDALGYWTARSTDGGKTWEKPVRTTGTRPHNVTQLKDGRILAVGLNYPLSDHKIATDPGFKDLKHEPICEESTDGGKSWHVIWKFSVGAEVVITGLHEPHMVELGDGRLIAMYRYHAKNVGEGISVQSESSDGGRTWTPLHRCGIRGYPPHLTLLSDGRLLCVYCKRTEGRYGQWACFSEDGGKTWDSANEVHLCGHWCNDLGYPASVELPDKSVFTVYYQPEKRGERPCIMGTRWIPKAK